MTNLDQLLAEAPVGDHAGIQASLAKVPQEHRDTFGQLAHEMRHDHDLRGFGIMGILAIVVFLVKHMGTIIALLQALIAIPSIIAFIKDLLDLFPV